MLGSWAGMWERCSLLLPSVWLLLLQQSSFLPPLVSCSTGKGACHQVSPPEFKFKGTPEGRRELLPIYLLLPDRYSDSTLAESLSLFLPPPHIHKFNKILKLVSQPHLPHCAWHIWPHTLHLPRIY